MINKNALIRLCFFVAIYLIAVSFPLGKLSAAPLDSLADINAFWKTTKAQLALEPLEAHVEPLKDPLPYHTYKVTLRSLNGAKIYALMAIPIRGEAPAKPWPVVITPPGYGGVQQGIMLSECQRGYVILQVYPRGTGDLIEDYKIAGANKFVSHIEKPDGYYYQGVYADIMRVIDFVLTRPDMDHNRIAMVSTSQGGGISLAVAAIDNRIKVVAVHVPMLCNFPMAAQMPSLVKTLLDKSGQNNQQALATLKYFDPWRLAPQLHVPVLVSTGGKDVMCPMPTIKSMYNRLPGKKKLIVYPDLPHTSCMDFYQREWLWLQKYLK